LASVKKQKNFRWQFSGNNFQDHQEILLIQASESKAFLMAIVSIESINALLIKSPKL
jgi:hypothetical protein